MDVRRVDSAEVARYARARLQDDADEALYRELAERGVAAAAFDDGAIVGAICASLGDELFVHDLYVEPSFRDAGVGTQLFDEIGRDREGVPRAALLRADVPSAVAFLAKRGVPIRDALVRVTGAIPKEDDLLALAATEYRFGVTPVDPQAHARALDALDREVRGVERAADHASFARAATGIVFTRERELAGYAYVWPSGRIGPIACASASYGGAFFAYALAASARSYGASWCSAHLPATNVRALRTALRAGLRIEATHAFAAELAAHDFSRYVAVNEFFA